MSSTNPRRAAFRSDGQSPRHQQSHPGSKSSTPQPSSIRESDEVRALRSKFGAELRQVKEVFPAWSDEDILNLLSETNGSVDSAVARIADGRAEQWDAVPRKKDKRGGAPSGAGSPHLQQQQHYARDRAESGGAASPGRGSGFRGRGGGRGGRGGGNVGRSGGRGGHHNVNGRGLSPPAGADPTANDDAPVSESTDDGRKHGDQTNGVADGAAQTHVEPEQKSADKQPGPKTNGTSSLPSGKPQQQPVKAAPVGPPKMSWAQIAKPKPKPVAPPVQQPQAPPTIASSAPLPAPPKAEVPAQAGPESPVPDSPVLEEEKPASEVHAPANIRLPETAEPVEEESATTAPGDDWIAITPPPKPSVELPSAVPPSTEAPSTKSWTEISAPPAPVCTSTPAADAPVPPAQDASEATPAPPPAVAPEVLPAPPPGLPSLPSTSTSAAPAPSSIPRSSTPSTKPATPRPSSHRVSARFRPDAPVVMPGGIGHIATGTPTLSFGSAVIGTGFDTPTRSMQFGSLSLNDDLDSSAPSEPPAPEPAQEEEPAPVPVPAPAPAPPVAQQLEPAPKPEPSPIPVAAPIPEPRAPTPPQQPVQQQAPPTLPSTGLSGISSIYQQQHSSPLPSLPQQVTTAQSAIPSQAQTSATPSTLPFTSQGPAPGLQLPQQQQQNHQAQSLATHAHQPAQSQHVSPAQSTNNLHAASQHQAQSQTQATQQPTPQHLPYSSNHQLPPHLDTGLTSQPAATHPAVAAQNQYFRQESSYFHTPTPPHTQSIVPQTQHQLSQAQDHSLSHSSPYGTFSPLAQTQASHLSGFGGSPAPGDYGTYDAQRNFYDTYGQASAFPNRTQLGHEDTTKTGLPGSAPGSAGLGQQSSALGQGQPALTAAQQTQQQQQFPGMMPYYYSQPYYMPNQFYPQSNPYPPQPPYVKYPSYQPPHQPGAPPLQQQGGKPPASTATPYGSQQTHNYHPGQTASYEDPSGVGYQQGTTATADYGKQAPLYSQGIQNFFGAQTPVQSAGGPQLGTAGQQRGTSGTSTSPENSYKGYTGPAGVADKQGQQQTGQGRGSVPGGPQPQGGYYNNRYSNAPQAPAQAYPQSDGQFYPSYQHQQPRQPYWP